VAKVKLPLSSAEARGKVGDVQYNTWRGLHVVKSIGTPLTQHSPAQDAARAVTAALAAAWTSLTSAQRALWQLSAGLYRQPDWTGNDRPLHGQACFIKANWLRLSLLSTWNPIPMPRNEFRVMTAFEAYQSGSDMMFEWGTGFYPDEDALWIQIRGQNLLSPARTPDIHYSKHLGYTLFDAALIGLDGPPPGTTAYWLRTFSVMYDYPTFPLLATGIMT
jgi:hypothetical protein